MQQRFWLATLAAALAATLACSSDATDPLSPSAAGGLGSTNAASDGSTLKVDAPTPVSPINDQQPSFLTLTVTAVNGKYGAATGVQYNFEVYSSANVRVLNDTSSGTSLAVAAPLNFGQKYTWRARATMQGAFGPWSTTASFIAPAGGYNTAGELYDPLISGRTVGITHGDVQFIPGVGVQLLNNNAHIEYPLLATIPDGEISMIVTNICSCSGQPGVKTKLFAMSEGYENITINNRRFTVEKRSGADKGVMAWRFVASGGVVDTEGAEREFVQFDPTRNYLVRASYRGGNFNVTIDEVGGGRVYASGKSYKGSYNPNPQIAWLGSPLTPSGTDSGTVANMIVRHLWISSRERPNGISQ